MFIRSRSRRLSTVLSALLCAALMAGAVFAGFPQPVYAEGEGPVITVQPESAEVVYPAGATFHIEVEDPDNVASYQWYMSDGYNLFTLDGSSATTDTLVVPSTSPDDGTVFINCIVTDKDGRTAESDPVMLTNTDEDPGRPVLYIGEYGIEPGQSFDAAEKGIGSGRVDYDADGVTITLTDLKISNEGRLYDQALGGTLGIMLFHRGSEELEYHVQLKGDNVIDNKYFDPSRNAAGIDFNAFFACGDDENKPTIIFEGDGTLTLNGGGNQIYTDSNLEIAANIKTTPNGLIFCDGIRCNSLFIDEGAELDLRVNGTAIHTEGDMRMYKDSYIKIESASPHVSVGPTSKNLLFIVGSLYMDGARIDMEGKGDPDNFIPYDSYLASFNGVMLAGEGGMNLKDSIVSIELGTIPAERVFTLSLGGVYGAGNTNYIDLSGGSTLYIDIDGRHARNTDGLAIAGILSASEDSRIIVSSVAKGAIEDYDGAMVYGEASGVEALRKIELDDSSLEVKVQGPEGSSPNGIVCGELSVKFSDSGSYVYCLAENGMALAADTGERTEEPGETSFSDTSEKITLDGAYISRPEDAVFGKLSTPGFGQYISAEAVFSAADKERPADEVLISGGEKPEKFSDVAKDAYYHDAVYWAVEKGITNGTSDCTFTPDKPATRADFVRFIYRAAGSPEVSGELPFTDVSDTDDWYKAVLWAYNSGVTKGVSDTEFGPSAPISRDQVVTMLHRNAGEPESSAANPFTDVKEDDYFCKAVLWAVEKGITKGTSDIEFTPGRDCSRAEVVTFLYREMKD